MSKEELAELLAHRDLRELVRRIVREELQALQVQPPLVQRLENGVRHRVVPVGFATYQDAAARLGVIPVTIRQLVSRGVLSGGNGHVSIASLDAYASKRHLRHGAKAKAGNQQQPAQC